MMKKLQIKSWILLLAVLLGGGSAWAGTVTFTAGTDTSEGTSITKDGITISFSSGVFNRTDNYRCYSGASMTISSTVGNITQIDFTATSSNPMTKFSGNPDVGAWTDSNKTQWKGDAAEINFGTTSGQCRMTEIVVTYTGGGSSTLDDCDLALTDAPVALSFDLYNNATAQVINYTTSSTGAVTIDDNDYATFAIDEENKTITVTPTAVTPSAQTITVNQEADETYEAGSKTFTITITDSTPIPTYTVTLGDDNTTLAEATGGAGVTLPSRDANGDYTFAGWSEENISEETTTVPTIIPAGEYNPTQDITLYPVYTRTEQEGSSVEEWVEIFETPADGTYAICSGAYFMAAEIESKRFKNGSKAPWIADGKLKVAPASDCQWDIYVATDGYYRIKNGDSFAGATGSNNQGALLDDESANYAKWAISYSEGFVIENVGMASAKKNKTLRNNTTYGWGTYAAGTGDAPRLFKKQGGITTTTYYVSTPVASITPKITVADAIISVDAEVHDGTLALAYANLTITDMSDFSIQYYDAKGEETSDPEWIEVTVAEQDSQVGEGYVVSYYMIENDGEARTAYFKVYALDDETNLVYSNLVTVTQAEYVAPIPTTTYTRATSITAGKHYIITDGSSKVMGGQNTNNRAAVSDDGITFGDGTVSIVSGTPVCEFFINGSEGKYTIYDENEAGYLYAASSSSNYLRTESVLDDNGKWSIEIEDGVATIIAQGENEHNWMRYNSSGLFSCYSSTSTQQDIYLYEKDGESAPTDIVTISAAGYATYYSDNTLNFTGTGLTAYRAVVTDNTANFVPVTNVPANQGVLLKGDAGSYSIPEIENAESIENAFVGVTVETTINTDPENGIFVLMKGDWEGGKGVGFYRTTGSTFTLSAHTAYLPADVAGARTFIGFDFNDATAINGIAAETMANGEVYNLQGQRVVKAHKGLYIMNGKKVLVK